MDTNEKHPLHGKIFGKIGTWESWQERWKAAKEVEDALTCLHSVFNLTNLRDDECEERLRLLLRLADGHEECVSTWAYRFQRECEQANAGYVCNDDIRDQAERRKAIAEKAFGVLCDSFFALKDQERPGIPATVSFWVRI